MRQLLAVTGLALALLAALAARGGVVHAEPSIEAQAAEYRQLRQVPGWFSGGKTFVRDVDAWGGRKHRVMDALGKYLGDGRATVQRATALMGPPDEITSRGSEIWAMVYPASNPHHAPPEGVTLLRIYHWRGRHDFLYFACRGGQIVASGWWMAGE